ncbi:hypothetical protein OWV82_001168 [Melia azedarach]|uniref:Uncharacterized protein n=1 Tax=Melia azedarach TaxID=155640 RepID=A0ACC1YXI4_MELAZ|nr:hypothetical protein OWV82_001168 [Melia azedarach]
MHLPDMEDCCKIAPKQSQRDLFQERLQSSHQGKDIVELLLSTLSCLIYCNQIDILQYYPSVGLFLLQNQNPIPSKTASSRGRDDDCPPKKLFQRYIATCLASSEDART